MFCLQILQMTSLLTFICIDANAFVCCPIRAKIEEIMHVSILAVSGTTPKLVMFQGVVPK